MNINFKLKNLLITSFLIGLISCSSGNTIQQLTSDPIINEQVEASWWFFHKKQHPELNQVPIITQNNTTKLLTDGEQIFPEIYNVIDSAKKKIYFTTYLFGESIGHKVAEKLIEKKKQGLDIQVVVEENMGIIPDLVSAAKKEYKFMSQNGIELRYFPVDQLPKGPTFLSNTKVITHVKVVIADDSTAIIGGMNVKDSESVNHDYMIEIQGQSVKELSKITDNDYQKSKKFTLNAVENEQINQVANVDKTNITENPVPIVGTDIVEIAQTGFTDQNIDNLMINHINNAQKSINIEMLLLDYKPIVDALLKAKKRGVEIKVILDEVDVGKFNKILSKLPISGVANFGAVSLLIDAGISVKWFIPQKKDQMLHAKTMLIDEQTLIIGSANMTYHAFTRNHEISVAVTNPVIANQFSKTFQSDWATKTRIAELKSSQKLIGKLFQKLDDWIYKNKSEEQITEEITPLKGPLLVLTPK